MKRAGLFCAIVLICFLTGCATSGKAALVANNDPIALVSMVSNLDIHWKDEEPISPKSTNFISKRKLRADPDMAITMTAEELIIKAEKLFRDSMAESKLINLAENEKVIFSTAYKNARLNKLHVDWEKVKPENFRLINFRDKNFFPALAKETGIKRSMFVEFYFTTEMASGVGKLGTCRADLQMMVLIMNEQGKTIYRKTIPGWSGSTTKVISGAYSRSDMMSLFESAIDEACLEFLDQLAD